MAASAEVRAPPSSCRSTLPLQGERWLVSRPAICTPRSPRYAKVPSMSATPSWDDLRVLLALHRQGSFVGAGAALGVAGSTVARRIETLERGVGRVLVHRGNDGTRLDPDALRLVALAEELEVGLAALGRGSADDVAGVVRVSASEGMVRPMVPVFARLHVKHPALSVELIAESRLVDLARREADIGLRMVPSTSSSVISRLMGRGSTGVYAARAYIERRLPGASLSSSLAGAHDWIGLDASLERIPQEQWLRAYGAKRFTFRSSSAVAIEHAVVAGMGLAILSDVQARSFADLVRVDLEREPPHVDVYLAYHRDGRAQPRVRVVVRALEAEIKRQLA